MVAQPHKQRKTKAEGVGYLLEETTWIAMGWPRAKEFRMHGRGEVHQSKHGLVLAAPRRPARPVLAQLQGAQSQQQRHPASADGGAYMSEAGSWGDTAACAQTMQTG